MLVYPTVETAEDFSRTRLQPMVKGHKRLRKKMLGDRHLFTTLRMQFSGMDLFLSGASSAASLASKPIEYLLMDEVGKFASQGLGDEAAPVSLAMERTKTFTHSRKIFMVSTPTTAAGRITREIEDCECLALAAADVLGIRHCKRASEDPGRDRQEPVHAVRSSYVQKMLSSYY